MAGVKLRLVLVRCVNVSTDGDPVDCDGVECFLSGKPPLYTWEIQRRGEKWLKEHRGYWKNLTTDH